MNKGNGGKTAKRVIQALFVAAAVVLCFLVVKKNTMASFNENEAVKYSVYSASHTIDNSTLFIGTYLININAMTDELYEKAMDSASDSNQNDMFYKSELSGGAWFNVTNAEGLGDITDSGEAIPESELADLFVQYYVSPDGVVTNVVTGDAINPFDIPDPYNLSKLPELNPLWLQYANSSEVDEISEEDYLKNKNSSSTGNTRTDVYMYRLLTTFFSMDLRDSVTDGYDADLARLFACYRSLKDSGQDEEADIIYSLMAKVDAARRQVVMEKLSALDVNALDVLYELANGEYYTSFGDFKTSGDDEDDITGEPNYIRELRDCLDHEFTEDDSSDDWWQPLQSTYDEFAEYAEPKSKSSDDGEEEEEEDESFKIPKPAFAADDSLLSAIGDSMESCQESYSECLSKALNDSDMVLAHAEYEY